MGAPFSVSSLPAAGSTISPSFSPIVTPSPKKRRRCMDMEPLPEPSPLAPQKTGNGSMLFRQSSLELEVDSVFAAKQLQTDNAQMFQVLDGIENVFNVEEKFDPTTVPEENEWDLGLTSSGTSISPLMWGN